MKSPALSTHFVILAGPLGSGKTTLIEELLSSPEISSTTAVIVNEAGAVNVDGAILSETGNGLTMATLSNGCVCCSLTNDLVFTIEELVEARARMDKPAFERIVLECSGLSKPGQVIRSLAGLAHLRMKVSVIATYDCSRPPLVGGDFDAEAAQLSAAQTIVLTKGDMVSLDQRKVSAARARSVNPFATLVDAVQPKERCAAAFKGQEEVRQLSLVRALSHDDEDAVAPHPRVQVLLAKLPEVEWEEVLDWLENVAGAIGTRLLRMKALIVDQETGTSILLQSVGTTFSSPRRLSHSAVKESSVVFIVRDCNEEALAHVPTAFPVSWN